MGAPRMPIRFDRARHCVVYRRLVLARSALLAGSGDIKGIAEALDTLRNTTYGIWLFSIVAAGLVAFGVYSVLEALYRRINTD